MRVRSGFEIEEVEPAVIDVSIFGPFIEFLDDEDDDVDLEDLDSADEDNEP